MTVTLAQLRGELATALAGVDGLVAEQPAVNPGFPLHRIGDPLEVTHNYTGGGIRRFLIPVTTYVATNDVDNAVDVRDALVVAVADAINANNSLLADIWATSSSNYRPETIGKVNTLAVDTIVEAIG